VSGGVAHCLSAQVIRSSYQVSDWPSDLVAERPGDRGLSDQVTKWLGG
jgi:hypothetical protein